MFLPSAAYTSFLSEWEKGRCSCRCWCCTIEQYHRETLQVILQILTLCHAL